MSKIYQPALNATESKRNQTLKQYAPLAVAAVLILACNGAFAASGDELGDGVCALVKMLQGKFVIGTAILAMIGSGLALLFGAELTDGIKRAVTIVAVVGFIVSFGGILTRVFPTLTGC